MPRRKDPRLGQFANELLAQVGAHPYLKHLGFFLKPDNSLDAKTTRTGVKYSFMFREHETEVVLYLDTSSRDRNKAYFDRLAQGRGGIEKQFKARLDWRRQDGSVPDEDDTKVSRVCAIVTEIGYLDDERWPEINAALLDAMLRLHRATADHVAALPASARG
jgi:hypothetical protein